MRDHPRRRVAGWILLAMAGLAIAVALSVTASNLSRQPIGISGQALRAGDRLAPADVTRGPAVVPGSRRPSTKPRRAAPTVSGQSTGRAVKPDTELDDHTRGTDDD